MNIIHRITATVSGTISELVSHVENHDAIVESALNDARAASARASVRLTRLRKDGEAMRARLTEAQTMEATWEERAVRAAAEDATKALECVKRRNACRKEAANLTAMLARHEEAEREVGQSVQRIEARLAELTQQRNMLRSRHSAADAMRVISRIENDSANGIEDIFDRWEMRITEAEYVSGGSKRVDTFETGFAKQEDEAALKADLEALLAAQGKE